MMVPSKESHHVVVAKTPLQRSDVYWDEYNKVEMTEEPEFIHYPDVKGFAIQWHPEGMNVDSTANKYLQTFIGENV